MTDNINQVIKMEQLEHHEVYRIYYFPDGIQVRIDNVTAIAVRPSGNHRLMTVGNKLFIIKPDWRYMEIVSSVPFFQL